MRKRAGKRIRNSVWDTAFNGLNELSMIVFAFICIYPFIYILALSLNDGIDAQKGGIFFYPRKFSLQNYITIFKNPDIVNAYSITLFRVIVGTVLSVLFVAACAYAMSRHTLPFKRVFNWMILIPMYFSGGMIPYYLIVNSLGFRDNILVYVIPSIYGSFNIILMRTFMKQLPESLNESARLDGAGDFIIFVKIILPLSMPVIATVALFTAVYHWNDWFTATIFATSKKMWPASTLLLNILKSSEISSFISTKFFVTGGRKKVVTPEALKMAMLVVTVLPIVVTYPFLQKYFVKGVMIGSLKE